MDKAKKAAEIEKAEENGENIGTQFSKETRVRDEDEEMQEQVKEYLDRKSVPYVESQKIRDIKRGLIRIGTTFKLRQDFYSAMWIYLHKVDYLLPQASDLKS